MKRFRLKPLLFLPSALIVESKIVGLAATATATATPVAGAAIITATMIPRGLALSLVPAGLGRSPRRSGATKADRPPLQNGDAVSRKWRRRQRTRRRSRRRLNVGGTTALALASGNVAIEGDGNEGEEGEPRLLPSSPRSSSSSPSPSSPLPSASPAGGEVANSTAIDVAARDADDRGDGDDDYCYDDDDDDDDEDIYRIRDDRRFLERNKYWVVLIDDEEPIRMAVCDYLYDEGYQVTACSDSDSFWNLLMMTQRQQRQEQQRRPGKEEEEEDIELIPPVRLPDAIVCDIRMPDSSQDGIELLSTIRGLGGGDVDVDVEARRPPPPGVGALPPDVASALSRVPVVMLTAKAMTRDRVVGFRSGADGYISKPFDPDELLSALDNVILRRRQMAGKRGALSDIRDEIKQIKRYMRRAGSTVVRKTTVYLSPSERRVLELLCEGYTNREIADERDMTPSRVTRSIQKLYDLTRTKTRTELVRWAIQTGYVQHR